MLNNSITYDLVLEGKNIVRHHLNYCHKKTRVRAVLTEPVPLVLWREMTARSCTAAE